MASKTNSSAKPRTVKVTAAGNPMLERYGYVFQDEGANGDRDAWNWAAHDPRNGKCVAEGHGFNSRAAAKKALLREILGVSRLTYGRKQ